MDEKVSLWRSFLTALLCWTTVALLLGWGMFDQDRDNHNFLPLAHYFVWAASIFITWAFITPFLFAFARRFPFDRAHWPTRAPLYALVILAVLLIHPWLTLIGWLYLPDRHQTFLATGLYMTRTQVLGNLQICITLLLLAHYQNAKRESRRRLLREAELEARVSHAELHMLRMQLNPHFLFNALQAATVLVHDDPHAAERVLQRLSELLRVALDSSRNLEVPLHDELAFLENYLAIQKQRFHDRLDVRFDIPADTRSIPVPSLLLQPLVENAIHHGIGKHKGSDIVQITARRSGEDLSLRVTNLAGSLSSTTPATGHGVGLSNTQARLQQMYGDRASVLLEPLSPTGVCATVTLPVERLA